MRTALIVAAWTAALPAMAQTAPAAREPRVRLFADGLFRPGSLAYASTRSFALYAETARIDSDYTAAAAAGVDAGIELALAPHLGIAIGYASANRTSKVTFTASLPHPLYLDRPRTLSGDASGLRLDESALFADMVLSGRSGPWELQAFAGASRMSLTTDVIDEVRYTENYPFDAVALSGTSKVPVSGRKLGWNGGADIDCHVAPHFGVGVLVRYDRASMQLTPPSGATLSIDAGGLQVAAGLRLYF